MRVALANLEATLRLFTKNKVDVTGLTGMGEAFSFKADLGKLIDEAKGHVHTCEDLVDYSKAEVTKLRKVVA